MSTVETIERHIERAARHLNPVMTNQLDDGLPIIQAVHDALNALAAARLQLGLLQETNEVREQ